MVTGDHDSEASERLITSIDWAERVRQAHGREWAADWQYGRLWRFVPRPASDTRPEFEPFGPDPLPGDGWELNVDAAEDGIETRSPAQPDVLMQVTYWRRPSRGMKPWVTEHKISRQYE